MEKKINKPERVHWLDIGKGIAMLFVMLSHTIWVPDIYGQFFRPIYLSFFFCASGYVFSLKKNFKSFVVNKCRTLLMPLITLSIINFVSSQVISVHEHDLKEDIIGTILQIRGKNDYMWFVACLFVAEIVFYYIVRFIKGNYKWIIYILGFLYSFVLSRLGLGPFTWHIQTIGVAVFFLGLGYEFKHNEEKLKPFFNAKCLLISGILYMMLMVFKLYVLNDWETVKVNNYGSNLFVWLSVSLIANWFFTQVIVRIDRCRWLEFIGKNTLIYFAFQFKFQRIFEILVNKTRLINLPCSKWYISFISVAFEAVCLAGVAIIFNRYLYFLLGKKKQS